MRKNFFAISLAITSLQTIAQVGIGTSTPNASAALEVQSTNSGILIPRMSSSDRSAITQPATGLLIYNTTIGNFEFYSGSAWVPVQSGEISNSDVASNAAIAYSKLNLAGSISNSDVAANAAIDFSKLNISSSDIEGLGAYTSGTGIDISNGTVSITPTVVTANYTGSVQLSGGFSAGGAGDGSAILTANSTDKGFLPPRMTAAQRTNISQPATGLLVYQSDGTKGLYAFDGSSWHHQTDWYSNTASTPSVFSQAKPANIDATGAVANIGIGSGSLAGLTDGDNNVALGVNGLNDITTAGNSTAIGYGALSTTTGAGNSALGYNAGTNNITGSNNTFIGSGTSALGTGLTNATAIGYGAEVTTSNTIQLGNGNTTNVNTGGGITTGGRIGVGTTTPNSSALLDIVSTSKGILIPRMTTTQRNAITSVAEGLMIYNTTSNQFEAYKKSKLPEISMIDQMPDNPSHFGFTGADDSWQSFTATESGYLTRITLYQRNGQSPVTSTNAWSMTVYSGVTSNNGYALYGGKQLGYTTIIIPANNTPELRDYVFDPPIHVESGQQYWFQINDQTATGNNGDTFLHPNDVYLNNNSWVAGWNDDILFEVFIKPEGSLIWCVL